MEGSCLCNKAENARRMKNAGLKPGATKNRKGLAEAGPVVGNKDGIDGIGRIVLDAGGLAGNEAL